MLGIMGSTKLIYCILSFKSLELIFERNFSPVKKDKFYSKMESEIKCDKQSKFIEKTRITEYYFTLLEL